MTCRPLSRIASVVCLAALLIGCSNQPADSQPGPATSDATDTAATDAAAADEPSGAAPTDTADADADTPDADTPDADTPDADAPDSDADASDADTSPAADQPAPGGLSTTVQLGSAELTAGIPGEGDLTVEQIQQWLDTPGVMEPLTVDPPEGVALGTMYGLEENPLTRAKIELGRQLYFDTRLSSDSTVSCASCHHPDHGYAFETQFGVGVDQQTGNRNSPVAYNRLFSQAQFWDGRAESLEAQAVGPIANPIEMGNTHEQAVDTVAGIPGYKLQFDRIFPGEGVSIDNIGKAIASFERVLVTGAAPYDYYERLRAFEKQFGEDLEDLEAFKEDEPRLYETYMAVKEASDEHPMSESARRGRELFFGKAKCTECHAGGNFTDEKYHNLGVGMEGEEPDPGRFAVTEDEKDFGAFKTPTVRNVALTAPYMHDGSQKTLEEVVEWYDKGGHPNPHLSDKIVKLNLTDQEKKDLVEFMKALTGPFPEVETGRLPQ